MQLRSHLEELKLVPSNGEAKETTQKSPEEGCLVSPTTAIEELQSTLKTAYPLLVLTIENMAEHIIHRLRSSPEEDLYRVLVTLLSEAYQVLSLILIMT